jgi:hypothetical protein
MKNRIYIFIIVALLSFNLAALFDDYEPSPRARALGGAFYSTSNDANAVFYNPAGLGFTANNLLVSYTQVFDCDFFEVSTVAFSMQLPKNFGTIGFGLLSMDSDYLGVNLYSEKTYSVAHSINLLKDIHSQLNFGYTINLNHLAINGNGNQAVFGLNVGALATLHKRTKIGFTFYNINNPKMGQDNSQDLPQKLAMGISYDPYLDVTTSLELKKSLNGDTEIHAGAEVKVIDMLTLRLGTRTNPNSFSAGARFDLYNVVVDYAANTHTMGLTHHFGIGYKF